jgi:hypothetical protein
LADVIMTLPYHLQPDNPDTQEIQDLESAQPWIKPYIRMPPNRVTRLNGRQWYHAFLQPQMRV